MSGISSAPLRGPLRELSHALSIAVAVVLLVGLAMFGSGSVGWAATKTAVSSFAAKPSSLTWAGGAVTLSAKVSNAKRCTFSAKPAVRGLPVTKPCSNGTVDQRVIVPKNEGEKAATYTFGLSLTGTVTVKANPIVLSEGDVLPGAPTSVSASPADGSATVSFTRPASSGRSAITGFVVTATDTTNSSNGGQRQSGGSSPITVKGLTNGNSYTFTVAAINASGTGPSSVKSNSVTPASRCPTPRCT